MRVLHHITQPGHELFYLSPVLVLALLYRLFPLTRGLGQDELYTAVHFVDGGSVWTTISSSGAFNNHIGYSLMARFSEGLFGRSEWALRLPALLLGLASLYSLLIFSRSILAYPFTLMAPVMLALSPTHIAWSVSARGYSAMTFFTILSSYLYFRLLRRPTRVDAFFFIVVSVLGIYVHLYSTFVTLVQMLFLLRIAVAERAAAPPDQYITRTSFRVLCSSFLVIGMLSLICYLPAAWSILSDLGGRGRSGFFNWAFPWMVLQEITGSESPSIVLLVGGTSLLGGFALFRSRLHEAQYFTWLLIGPFLVMWLARPFDLYPRFFTYWSPYYFMFFIAGLHLLWYLAPNGNVRLVRYLSRALAAVTIAAVLHNWSVNWQNDVADEGYREASRAIVAGAEESVAFCAIGGARSVWQYYIDRPIAHPLSVVELQELRRTHAEVRCIYYKASWQSDAQTEIAQFLLQHASWSKVKDLILFVYRG